MAWGDDLSTEISPFGGIRYLNNAPGALGSLYQPSASPPVSGMTPVSSMWANRPDIAQQLTGAGINELPSWLSRYTNGNINESDFLSAWQQASAANPWDYFRGSGKLGTAANQALGMDALLGNIKPGSELPPETLQAFQQAFLDKKLQENRGGFGLSEALGLGVVAAPIIAGASIPALVGGGTAAGVGGVGGAAGALGAPAVSGYAGLSGPELVALTGGGSGLGAAGAGGAGMGFLDSLGGALSGGWGNVIQGGLGVLGSYLGGQEAKEGYEKGSDAIMQMYMQNRADMAPLLGLLQNYTGQFADVASKGGMDYTNDPIYQADKAEMLRTLNRGQASRGLLRSSDTDNAITRNLSTLMNNAYARKYGGLLDLMKLGSGAASSAGSLGANTGNALAGTYGAQGNAAANTIGGMFGSGMGALNNYQLMNMLANMRR